MIPIKVRYSEDIEIEGKELYRVRNAAGLSRAALADKMQFKGYTGWSKVMIWRMELRRREPIRLEYHVAQALFEAMGAEAI